jgi:hypothetical protein
MRTSIKRAAMAMFVRGLMPARIVKGLFYMFRLRGL